MGKLMKNLIASWAGQSCLELYIDCQADCGEWEGDCRVTCQAWGQGVIRETAME